MMFDFKLAKRLVLAPAWFFTCGKNAQYHLSTKFCNQRWHELSNPYPTSTKLASGWHRDRYGTEEPALVGFRLWGTTRMEKCLKWTRVWHWPRETSDHFVFELFQSCFSQTFCKGSSSWQLVFQSKKWAARNLLWGDARKQSHGSNIENGILESRYRFSNTHVNSCFNGRWVQPQGSFLDCFIRILRCFPLAATIMGGSGNVQTNTSFRNMPRSSLAQQRCSEFQPHRPQLESMMMRVMVMVMGEEPVGFDLLAQV